MLAGDREAFRLLVREHHVGLRSFLGSQLHHADEMDDLAQEVFLEAFCDLSRYEMGRDFRAWLRGIARNRLLMHFRTVGRRRSHEAKFREEATGLIQDDLEQAFVQQSDFAVEALLRCINQLPKRMRRVVRAGLDGAKSASLAEELSVSIGAVYNLHYRAIGLLRGCVSKEVE